MGGFYLGDKLINLRSIEGAHMPQSQTDCWILLADRHYTCTTNYLNFNCCHRAQKFSTQPDPRLSLTDMKPTYFCPTKLPSDPNRRGTSPFRTEPAVRRTCFWWEQWRGRWRDSWQWCSHQWWSPSYGRPTTDRLQQHRHKIEGTQK